MYQNLEARRLLSVSVSFQNHFLQITGDDKANAIHLSLDPADNDTVVLRIGKINSDGIFIPDQLKTYHDGDIKKIVIDGKGGNDDIGFEWDRDFAGLYGHSTLIGGSGNDRIVADIHTDFVDGNSGNDEIIANANPQGNLIHAGSGDDTIVTEDQDSGMTEHANDTVFGGDGNDLISMRGGFDSLDGGAGDDTFYGRAGSDGEFATIVGGDGNDIVQNVRAASISMGKGNDTLKSDIWCKGTIDLGDGNDKIETKLVAATSNGVTVLGGAGNDVVHGTIRGDKIDGGSGNDKLYGEEGGDTLIGGSGNDKLYGQGGHDFLFGKDGERDTLDGGANDGHHDSIVADAIDVVTY